MFKLLTLWDPLGLLLGEGTYQVLQQVMGSTKQDAKCYPTTGSLKEAFRVWRFNILGSSCGASRFRAGSAQGSLHEGLLQSAFRGLD